MFFSKLISSGSYLPKKILTNDDLAKIVDTSDEWIFSRTGIKQRHIAEENEKTTDLALIAAQNALQKANLKPTDIDGIILATTTPDLVFPSSASILQRKLGAIKAFAFDIQAVCSGFIYALFVADSTIRSGRAERILVVGADTFSKILNWQDRTTSVLFGDGAGCVILEKTLENPSINGNSGILDARIFTDGTHTDELRTSEGINPHVVMNGPEVFKHAVNNLASVVDLILEKNNLTKNDVNWLVPHQANLRIITAMGKKLNLNPERVVVSIDKHANTSAASIPLALDTVFDKIQKNDLVLMEAMGGGFTWGAALFRM
ncbi:MAG: ketoacyl-ACP synthase III [Alphaproteobacteria bacterium]|jgi:3-oxoacyl-[acyl-carrier-protein] synthase-3|nr:ketoacyl-ACP synthase III [Alphaproteobacteria bacterium]